MVAFAAALGASAALGADDWTWIDGKELPIEGKAFQDTERYYDRLPAQWSNDYSRAVWGLQRDTAGMAFRFVTSADRIRVRWSLTSGALAMPHMPATGKSGVDVYQYGRDPANNQWRKGSRWNYCAPPFPTSFPKRQYSNEYEVAVRPGLPTMVYLPTYNGIREFALGVPKGKFVKPAPPRASGIEKPVVFYGTSTTQGGCTSRPSAAWPSIVGQEADVPIVNLGFSGSGRMEDVMVDVLARVDASLYVLDTIGNMPVDLIKSRYENFVRQLRAKRPDVPIMVTINTWCEEWRGRNGRIQGIFRKLKEEDPVYWKNLSLGGEGDACCADRNYAVEGVHLNDWGAWNVGRAFADDVRRALGLDRPRKLQAEGGMTTPWGDAVTPGNAWREYPRPQLVRGSWTNLNGLWDCAVVSATDPKPSAWEDRILVPFAFESALSGLRREIAPTDRMWYRRTFDAPALKDGERLLLHFDGVDWRAQVFVNGRETLDVPHEGPLPFTVDATAWVKRGENTLEVLAWDPTGTAGSGPKGKQNLVPGGCSYHRVSGIWQTVWFEVVPATRLASYRLEPDLANGAIRVQPVLAGDAMNASVAIDVLDGERKITSVAVKRLDAFTSIPLPHGWEAWSPAHPKLYDLKFTVENRLSGTVDSVTGYFGMRQIEKRKDAKGVWRIYLNGEPTYLMGILDQGYWPDGLWTPPSDEAMAFDVAFFKSCGLNMARKHVKVEPMRWYHQCDRQGLLVIQDLCAPCGGKGIVSERVAEEHDRLLGAHRRAMAETMDLLQASPCVIGWAPYNEGTAQPWAMQTHATLAWTKRRDPTRLVDGPSGWVDFDGGGWRHKQQTRTPLAPTDVAEEKGDLVDMHHYPEPNMHEGGDRASFLGEWGGVGLKVPDHLWSWGAWGYAEEPSAEAFERRYLGMVRKLEDLAAKGLSGSVYTQATDCEREVNGLITYDRRVPKVHPETVRAAHERVLSVSTHAAKE